MPGPLAAKVRAKFPGVYDDLDDVALERQVLAKYPDYADLAKPSEPSPFSRRGGMSDPSWETPDFRSSNATDASGRAVVREPGIATIGEQVDYKGGIGTFASHFGAQVNPVSAVRSMGNAVLHPVETVKGIGQAQGALFDKAKKSYADGDYIAAAGEFVKYLLPIIGPGLDQSSERLKAGQYAAGFGDAAGLGTAMVAPSAASRAMAARSVPKVKAPENAVHADAMRFAQERGIPMDAGTATGNRAVKGAQFLADRSIAGSMVAEPARRTQAAAVSRVGRELADEVHPAPMSPESAGGSLKNAVKGTREMFESQADEAYSRLRAFEADEANAGQVRRAVPVAEQRQVHQRMQSTVGSVPSAAELTEIRRMSAELEAMPFTKRTWNDVRGDVGKRGNAGGGDYEIVKGAAGAPVYDDIMQHAPGTSKMTRGEVRKALESALETGHFTNAAKGALEVARKRLAGAADVSKPSLPPDAGVKGLDTMLMPVDLRTFKQAMKPTYDEMMRAKDITPPMGDKARALVALDRVMNGPDYAPVSVADSALSDLKTMARTNKDGAARTTGQGVAAGAVSRLDAAVRAAVTKAGPQAVEALETGRAATRAKWGADDVWQSLSDEPVKAFNSAVLRKDSGITQLDKLAELAPSEMPKIGRAWLEDMADKMTREGGLDHAAKIKADWDNLGPRTRRTLFGPELSSELDRFFRVAAKVTENVNPSGSAYVGSLGLQGAAFLTNPLAAILAQVGGAGAAKFLHSPAGVRVLMKASQIRPSAAAPAKVAEMLAEAVRAGVLTRGAISPVASHVPRAAQAPEPSQP